MCIIKQNVDSLISVNSVKHQKFNQVYFCYDHMNIVLVTIYQLRVRSAFEQCHMNKKPFQNSQTDRPFSSCR